MDNFREARQRVLWPLDRYPLILLSVTKLDKGKGGLTHHQTNNSPLEVGVQVVFST